jgi:NMD protein affecting ribosome stability and mRNA decay
MKNEMTEQNGTPNNSFRMTYNCNLCGDDNNSTDANDLCPKCNKMETNKKWVIKYKDVKVHHHRHEVLHEDGEWYGEVGDIMTFQTKEKAQKFLNTLDSKEYDRWIEVEK